MRGLLFTEFLEYLETRFGPAQVDGAIEAAALANEGAFTAVDNYPAAEFYRLLAAVATHTGEDADALLVDYGRHMFQVFLSAHPEYFGALHSTAELMDRVEAHIHLEVKKLHPDAKPPRFRLSASDGEGWVLRYYSHRPLHALAHGLLEAASVHFDEAISVRREIASGAQDLQAVFHLMAIETNERAS